MTTKRVRLVQRRKSAGYTQEKLAERLGVERSTVLRWERAESEPQPWVRPKLAAALGASLDELQALLDDVTVVQTQPNDRMSYVLEHPSSADLVTVGYLHERIHQLDEQYDRTPSTALLGPAGQLHGQVKFVRENVANPRVRKALFEVEAESATFMGQLVWDVSQRRDHAAPITYLDDAVAAARQVRDPYTEAYAVLRKAFVALYGEKDPRKGLTLAGEGAEIAKVVSPSLTGLNLLHVAEGHAMTGDLTTCEEALKRAEAQLDRADADDIAASAYTINEFNRLAGSCYLFLGLPDRAEPILRATARALAAKQKSQAIALGNLALSLIRQGKLDEAAATMHGTIDAVEMTRGGGGLNLAFAAGRELRQWRHESWVQDINDRLLALIAAI
ncbi:helix-turn-helix transcriptional regulator [Amycolatopsis pigmentata]|uniref:Helix-turn-helix transcriptional regulator n=1 Tax=Amycolatopsis pigmentata TaxID=450801 RepID=A0ABW5FIM8_9PSEU